MLSILFYLVLQTVTPTLPPGDKGYCGIWGLETGEWDPFYKSGACPEHDLGTYADKTKQEYMSPVEVTEEFMLNVAETAGMGALAVGLSPVHFIIGGFGGLMLMGVRRLFNLRKADDPIGDS